MKNITLVFKGILFWFTFISSILFLVSAESLFDSNPLIILFWGISIGILVLLCKDNISIEELKKLTLYNKFN